MLASWQPMALLQEPHTLACILLSVKVSALVIPLLASCGVALGYVLGRGRGNWYAALDFLVTLPLIFPPIATGFLLLLLFGRRSPVGAWLKTTLGIEVVFSLWGVALAALVTGLPLITKHVQAAIRHEVNDLIENAVLLGKDAVTIFFRVTLPTLRKPIAIGMSLAFARILGDVGVTLMLGGNITGRTNTISLEIYSSVFTGEYERALLLVVLLGTIALTLLLCTRRLANAST